MESKILFDVLFIVSLSLLYTFVMLYWYLQAIARRHFYQRKNARTLFLVREREKNRREWNKNTQVKDIYKTFILRLISGQNISSELAYRLSDFPGITGNL